MEREVREGSSTARSEPQVREPLNHSEEDPGKTLETPEASASQPRRTKRRKWVDAATT